MKRFFKGKEIMVEENPVSSWLFSNSASAWIWLVLRLYLGIAWLKAGIGKVMNDAWVGSDAGAAITGFISGSLEKVATGDVPTWYAFFAEKVVLPNATMFSYAVALGEVFVGIGLIVGLLTGIAAFFGAFMNLSFLLAGTVSTNPMMFVIAILLILAWKVAGWHGVDRFVLPKLGTPWTNYGTDEDDGKLDSLKYFHYVD